MQPTVQFGYPLDSESTSSQGTHIARLNLDNVNRVNGSKNIAKRDKKPNKTQYEKKYE